MIDIGSFICLGPTFIKLQNFVVQVICWLNIWISGFLCVNASFPSPKRHINLRCLRCYNDQPWLFLAWVLQCLIFSFPIPVSYGCLPSLNFSLNVFFHFLPHLHPQIAGHYLLQMDWFSLIINFFDFFQVVCIWLNIVTFLAWSSFSSALLVFIVCGWVIIDISSPTDDWNHWCFLPKSFPMMMVSLKCFKCWQRATCTLLPFKIKFIEMNYSPCRLNGCSWCLIQAVMPWAYVLDLNKQNVFDSYAHHTWLLHKLWSWRKVNDFFVSSWKWWKHVSSG